MHTFNIVLGTKWTYNLDSICGTLDSMAFTRDHGNLSPVKIKSTLTDFPSMLAISGVKIFDSDGSLPADDTAYRPGITAVTNKAL